MKMADKITIREHTTSDILVQLLADNNAINLSTVHHVEWCMIDSKKEVYRYASNDASPKITIIDAPNGKIIFSPPDSNVFQYTRSPYKLHILVWETSTKKYSVPESGDAEIKIRREF